MNYARESKLTLRRIPTRLAKVHPETGDRPFHVIYLKDGRDVSWEGAEPNTIVWKYLSSKKQ